MLKTAENFDKPSTQLPDRLVPLTANRGSPEVSFQDLDFEHAATRIQALRNRLEMLAKFRAILIINRTANFRKIENLDRALEKTLSTNKELICRSPSLLLEFKSNFLLIQDQTLFEQLSERFKKLGKEIGSRHLRLGGLNKIQDFYQEFEALISQTKRKFPEFFAKYNKQMQQAKCNDSKDIYCIVPQSSSQKNSIGIEQVTHVDLEDALAAVTGEEIRKSIEENLKAEEAAHLIYQILNGTRKTLGLKKLISPNEIWEITKDLSDAQHIAMLCAYKDLYSETLDHAIHSVFEAEKLDRALHIVRGEVDKVYADTLYHILKGWTSKSKRGNYIRDLMSKIPISDWTKVVSEFNKEYGDRFAESNYYGILRNKINAYELDVIAALHSGTNPEVEAAFARSLLMGPRDQREKIVQFLKSLSSQELKDANQALIEHKQTTLVELISAQMQKSPSRDLALAILNGEQTQINAAEVKFALADLDTWSASPFFLQPQAKRQQLVADYEKIYCKSRTGTFWKDLRKAVSKKDFKVLARVPGFSYFLERTPGILSSYKFIKQVVTQGKLEPEDILRNAIEGLGHDKKLIEAVLSSMTRTEFEEAAARYKIKYPPGRLARFLRKIPMIRDFIYDGTLENDIRSECSGDMSFDIDSLIDRNLDCRKEPVTHLIDRYKHEISGSIFHNLRNRRFFKNNPVFLNMERDFRRAMKFYQTKIKGKKTVNPSDEIYLRTLVKQAHLSMNQYRRMRNGIAGLTESLVAGGAAALGTLPALLIGNLPYATVAICAGVFSFTSRWIFLNKFIGKSFGKHEKAWSVLKSLADGISIFTIQLGKLTALTLSTLGQHLGTSVSKKIVKSGVNASLHNVIEKVKKLLSSRKRAEHLLQNLQAPQLYRGPGLIMERFEKNLVALNLQSSDDCENDLKISEIFRRMSAA
ncbi:MAG: hypothetical protein R3A13_11025 [Bdellovibrionota bacterium]